MLSRRTTALLLGAGAVIAAAVPAAAAGSSAPASTTNFPPPCPVHSPVRVANGDVIIQFECSQPVVIPLPGVQIGSAR